MNGPHPTGHPHHDTLDAYATDTLDAASHEEVVAHLATCARCRREVQNLTRFLALNDDDELAAEADWSRAEGELEQRWQEVRSPQLSPAWWRRRATHRWWPVAAAAALFILVINVPKVNQDQPRGVVRGGEGAVIELVEPVGEVPNCPAQFAWSFEGQSDSYNLEIFTVDLEAVAAFPGLADTVWVTGAALCDSLVVGRRYLWSVQVEVGGEVTARSSAQWFRVKK